MKKHPKEVPYKAGLPAERPKEYEQV
jgi:hypothetical protein